jgi:hypothetical protein
MFDPNARAVLKPRLSRGEIRPKPIQQLRTAHGEAAPHGPVDMFGRPNREFRSPPRAAGQNLLAGEPVHRIGQPERRIGTRNRCSRPIISRG